MAGNPHGVVQAGVHGLLLDAAMNFAINSALAGRDRTRATLEMKIETMRPAMVGETYRLRGEVVRMARQVAYAEATVVGRRGPDGEPVDRHLPPPSAGAVRTDTGSLRLSRGRPDPPHRDPSYR